VQDATRNAPVRRARRQPATALIEDRFMNALDTDATTLPPSSLSADASAATPELRTAHRVCPLCEACCGLEIQVRGEQIVSIRGDQADPFSRGHICPKAVALRDLHQDPDRLRQPLARRHGRFEPISWQEAFDTIERRLLPILEQQGRDAVAVTLGNPIVHKLGLSLYLPQLVKALGSRNVFSASTLDQMPKHLACGLMFGHPMSVAVPDIDRCDWLLMLGANPMVSNGSMWTVAGFADKARALRERGGRLIVVDPRRTETAAVADAHHFIVPGSDLYLLAGMAHVLFAEQRLRLRGLQEHVAGLQALQDALQPFTPERAEAHCGIAADTVRQLARELATAERACVYGRLGTCTQAHGTLVNWLVDVLNVLTGHLDAPGGAMFPKGAALAANTQGKPGIGRGFVTGRHTSRVSGAPEVLGELPMVCLAEEIETPGPGQVRALITVASNPVLSAPNGTRLSKALDTLEFMVSVDIYLNETTRHADLILPGLSPLEEAHYDLAFSQLSHHNQVRVSAPVFAAPQGQWPEWQTLLQLAAIAQGRGARADVRAWAREQEDELARKLAGEAAPAVLADLPVEPGPLRALDLALRNGPYGDGFGQRPQGLTLAKVMAQPSGIDLQPLQPRVPELLRTPSGRIELAPAQLLQALAQVRSDDAAPDTSSAPSPHDLSLSLIGRRDVRSNNSWMHNLPVLAKGPERCTLWLHSKDAALRGLATDDGALVRALGRVLPVTVEINDDLMPGVVCLPHGWGHDLEGAQLRVAAERPGVNYNALVDETQRDPLSGNAVLNGVRVEVSALP
jgi:anaerobic selenocysteine-containing dehydrogenase